MIELRGKAVADAHKAVLSERLAELQAKGIVLGLGILLVGDDKAAQMYARFMEKTAKSAGFGVEVAHLSLMRPKRKSWLLLNGGTKMTAFMASCR